MKKRHYSKFTSKKLEMLKTVERTAIYVVIVLAVLFFVVGVSKVSGSSMEPTLHDGQPVIFMRLHGNYEKGDIVSVKMASGDYYVKRVAAVAGDTVDVIDGIVYVNGENNGSATGPTEEGETTVEYPMTLKEGQIFVLGDNREVSVDSRTFGPISTSQTRGKILFVN